MGSEAQGVHSHLRSMQHSKPNIPPTVVQKLNRAGDVFILVAASFVAAFDHGQIHWKVAIAMAAAALAFWTAGSQLLGHYDVFNGRGFLGDVALSLLLLTAVAVPMALLRLISHRYASTTQLNVFLGVLLPAVLWLRLGAVGRRLLRTRPVEQVLIVGVGALGRLTQRQIRDGGKRREVIGFLRLGAEESDPRLQCPVLGAANDLEQVLRTRIIDEVYLAPTSRTHGSSVQEAIRTCERFGIPFALPACDYRIARARPAHAHANPDGYLHYLNVPHRPAQAGMKRLIDIVASAVALIVLSPLLLVVAVLLKLTSRGPILFKQERVGMVGRTFYMLKFRSMVQNAEALRATLVSQNEQTGPVFKMKRDPRITAVGRFIRKYSIDELPQLVNVLRGDMSIVGPRPSLPSEVAMYEPWQRRRLSVRPGLTCVWQVSGRNEVSFEHWMMLDMRYIDHWSLLADLRLILRTVPAVLTGRGAS
jgi:exopolysaccharide biosynthesis polyprenyl glycosylphosphotransferase